MAKEDVKSVTVLQSDDDFGGSPETLYGKSPKSTKKKKKKQARALKPYEKMVFSMAKSYDKASKEYRDRHEKSNKKKKNGWIKDFPKNYNKAMSKLGGSGMGVMGVKLFE
ncbi:MULTISPECIES: hypothetical protein [Okeania]|uniref:DUF6312 domain-containing protein n=1 Tax=Okeania TaxID=1458928 RepID=UPI000F54A5BC|nr:MULTISPECIES: hypothetical protein [Okeania]NEP08146.1 hypothetical protein [Okeania sp. SIO4D6]NEP44440.1 hypothetical protein [Okeania sp. SIO2H7]NET12112.1 hypothetical protein [Okeania sp. SIO1H6]NEP75974.1 hypothetical protein [Okeania sp. SIO2G5]NEP97144.1 hypothetical protein [Okeania sp. SIO2F5]